MSRAVDLLLLAAVAFLGWKLLHMDLGFAGSTEEARPVTATLVVRGDASLEDLGVILRRADELDAAGMSEEFAPHQLGPWGTDRKAEVQVPVAGRYELRWGAQDEPAPRLARDVMIELVKGAKAADQHIVITEGMDQPIEIDLGEAHAAGIRALVRK